MATRGRVVLAGTGAAAVVGLVVLAWATTHAAGPVLRLDTAWHSAFRDHALRHPGWLSAMEVVTHLGDTVVVALINLAMLVLCLARGRRRTAVFVAAVSVVGWATRIAARDIVGRRRPEDALWTEPGFSFPSGHTANSAIAAGLVVVVVWPLLRSLGRTVVLGVAILYAVGVGLSRIAGGVHWPSDVLGGLLFATGFLCIAAAVAPGHASGSGPRASDRIASHP